jgi:hypothetical protein
MFICCLPFLAHRLVGGVVATSTDSRVGYRSQELAEWGSDSEALVAALIHLGLESVILLGVTRPAPDD